MHLQLSAPRRRRSDRVTSRPPAPSPPRSSPNPRRPICEQSKENCNKKRKSKCRDSTVKVVSTDVWVLTPTRYLIPFSNFSESSNCPTRLRSTRDYPCMVIYTHCACFYWSGGLILPFGAFSSLSIVLDYKFQNHRKTLKWNGKNFDAQVPQDDNFLILTIHRTFHLETFK